VAVPPADDGSVSRPAGQPSTPSARPLRVLTAALAVVVVACLGALTYLYATDTDESSGAGSRLSSLVTGEGRDEADGEVLTSRDRDAVTRQATQFVLRSNTYGPGDLDAQNGLPDYAERVRAVITAKQKAEFDKSLPLAEQTVAQAGYGRTCQVVAAGVQSLSSDEATALVAGDILGSYPDPEDPKKRIEDVPRQFRIQVTLRKVEGTWLVDSFEAVTGEVEQEPTETPSVPDPTPDGSGTGSAPSEEGTP
jgi:hypothetical protein